MRRYSIAAAALAAVFFAVLPVHARRRGHADPTNALKSLYTPDYLALKSAVLGEFKDLKPGRFGESVQGFERDKRSERKMIALTFDACGGRCSGFNAALIDYLRREKLRATLFVSGIWIEKNREIFLDLAKDPLFEIENHGLLHRACSINGKTKYGVIPTRDMGDVIDEMELNARKIAEYTGRRPVFFRSATAYADEASVKIAARLGMELVSYEILSCDSMRVSAKTMARNIIRGARHGSVVIMHFNHPEWSELEALKIAVPELKAKGYSFDKLKNLPRAAGTGKTAVPEKSTGAASVPATLKAN